MTIPHGGEFGHGNACPRCGSQFTTKAMLDIHVKIHDASPEEQERLFKEQEQRRP